MGKDLSSKNLLSCPDVFADIGNVNLFDGERIIHPEELEKLPTETIYRDNYGRLRHHYLDTRMKAKDHGTDIIVCMENQSGVSNIMPVRDMGYLYSGYSEQIRDIRKNDEKKGVHHIVEEIGKGQRLTPVISMILYYGKEKWTEPDRLSDMLEMPDSGKTKLRELIADHKIRVVHLAGQDEKTRAKYKSDFRHIVDYLACAEDKEKCRRFMQDGGRIICHPEEYLDMMEVLTSDKRFEKIKESVLKKRTTEKEEVTMFSIAEELENQGIEKKSREIIRNMLADGQPPELISKYTQEPLTYIYEVKGEM